MKLRIGSPAFIFLMWQGTSVVAQQMNVSATLDSNSILIGNQLHLRLSVTTDNSKGLVKIQFPAIADTIVSKLLVVNKSKIDTVIPDSSVPTRQVQRQELVLTSFDSGYYAIPPFHFVINDDTAHPMLTEALLLQVRTIPVDTTKGFRDIKGPIQVRFSFLEILPYIGYGLAGLAILSLIVYLIVTRLKRKPVAKVVIKEPQIPPHVKALKALEELALKKMWQAGKIKDYHTEITEILRVYVSDVYHFDALEMTTDEIINALQRSTLSDNLLIMLKHILILADLVKFAKEQPLPFEHESSLTKATDFIKDTAPVAAPEPVKELPPSEKPPAIEPQIIPAK